MTASDDSLKKLETDIRNCARELLDQGYEIDARATADEEFSWADRLSALQAHGEGVEAVGWMSEREIVNGRMESRLSGITRERQSDKDHPVYLHPPATQAVPEGVERDAVRYRWLRDEAYTAAPDTGGDMVWCVKGDGQDHEPVYGGALDAYIDSYRAANGEG